MFLTVFVKSLTGVSRQKWLVTLLAGQNTLWPRSVPSSVRTPRFSLSLPPQAVHEEAGARRACMKFPHPGTISQGS